MNPNYFYLWAYILEEIIQFQLAVFMGLWKESYALYEGTLSNLEETSGTDTTQILERQMALQLIQGQNIGST